MSLPKDKDWFPARRYGYGWGVPRRWQGWVVMIGYFAAFVGALPYARHRVGPYIAYVFALTAAMIGVCMWKGEALKWRWGQD